MACEWFCSSFALFLFSLSLSLSLERKKVFYVHIQYVDKCTNEKDESAKLKLLAEQEAITTDNTRVKPSEMQRNIKSIFLFASGCDAVFISIFFF